MEGRSFRFLCVGLTVYLELSTFIANLGIGATAANFSSHSRRVAQVQSRTDPPFYAIFFVIAGGTSMLACAWAGVESTKTPSEDRADCFHYSSIGDYIYELVGPLSTRLSLIRGGEVQPRIDVEELL
jgi:hypothetical protein